MREIWGKGNDVVKIERNREKEIELIYIDFD